MIHRNLSRLAPLIGLALLAGLGIAFETTSSTAGRVLDAMCINSICVTGYQGLTCIDDDGDGWCDRTIITPQPDGN